MSNTRKSIKKRVEFWQKRLGLINWEIAVVFNKLNYRGKTKELKGIACTQVEPRYKIAVITFAPQYMQQADDAAILHELVHCLVSDIVTNEETVVSELTNILYRFYREKAEVE